MEVRMYEDRAPLPAEDGTALIGQLLEALEQFTGPGWEQEDDITLVGLQRCVPAAGPAPPAGAESEMASVAGAQAADEAQAAPAAEDPSSPWRTLAAWNLRSEPGNERQAMQQVAEVV
jgi:hypothetical protein